MELKKWIGWIVIFLVMGSFTVYVYYPTNFIPSARAYSYDDAKTKIDWASVQNNTILLYSDEGDFLGNSFLMNREWALWQPAKDSFDSFLGKFCFNYEKVGGNGKIVFLFSQLSAGCRTSLDSLPSDVRAAYNGLKKKETRGTFGKHGLGSIIASQIS